MPKRSVRQSKVAQEIEILQQAGEHRNIIGFKDIFSDEDNYYIVMEMAEGGELFDRLVEQV
jgi:serine/threonine protein kinase